MQSISLGWNCYPAIKGVEMGLRKRKENGYKTCPFDECITNYNGVILCLEENFENFCNSKYLEIIEAPFSVGGIMRGEKLLYNNRYKFIFNHESPGHANLYITQKWTGGINHYINNDYFLFKKRYSNRINNFRSYLSNENLILFLISRYQKNIDLLNYTMNKKYPKLRYNIKSFQPEFNKKIMEKHYEIMKLSRDEIRYELN
ncbi:DUF1796 family putative cysteine peptidase [Cyanobacterium aponinum AL20118]|uniref:DUF1796 family putative cysteine peptidase n=1 Tax=Cyanobacterium aponinum AL20115 TaxID=3090662 RepID=A0AAF0ZDE4_9CHRO|nr:DUF1796 family putative cysteine peptidase [Cyanobacterium aponinum]PHV63603.1 hypothetical protein CSQ80_04545 [Cyanobacterium aponinum IPPAS B-1201]WPF88243.1 DUF1796 family putative cysteine peptidase [Cyanobacterium aponinum AL20115]